MLRNCKIFFILLQPFQNLLHLCFQKAIVKTLPRMNKLYKLSLLAAITFLTIQLSAQGLCPFIGPDLSLPCGQTSTTLTADFSNCPPGGPGPLATTSYTVANIPFSPQAVGGTSINMTDDSQQGPFNIGFSFCFFGNTYTQFYIGSNGWISFSAGQPTTFTSAAIPSGAFNVPKNCIMGPWQDWNPGVGGGPYIRYQTQGVAPCRRLVVSWTNIPMFQCTSTLGTFQIVLYESTNVIENHITSKQNCGWAGGTAVQGIHNLPGSVAVTVPGRNSTAWTTNNNAYRWTPSGAPVPVTYNWYQVGNPVPIGTGLTINVTPPAGGASYTCHPEYGACYNGYTTCMGFAGANGPDTINVIPGPPNIFPTIPGPYDFCPATSITVGADQLYAQYLWSDGSTGPTLTTSIPGPISVDVIDVNGCTGTATAVLNMLPNPILNVVPVNPSICPGGTVQMTASGANTYVWSPGASLDNPNSAVVNATPSSTTTYSIVGTDLNGCVDSTFNTVTVFTPPTVVANANDPGVCPTFGTTINAVGALNYVWTPAATITNPNLSTSTVFPTGTTTYSVTGTDANGCTGTDDVTVLVYDRPNANFSAPVVDGCAPVTVNLVDNSNISSGTIVSYQWNVEAQGIINSQNPSYTFSTPGSYDVQLIVTSDMGCLDTMSMLDYINAYSIPTAGFFATPNPATLGDALVSFTNSSSLDAVNFLWDFDGLGTSVGFEPQFDFAFADTFNITLIVSTIHGCSDTATGVVIVEDVSDIWTPNSFTPNNDGLNESWFPVGRNLGAGNTTIEVEVFDRWGMSVYYSADPNKPWLGKIGGTAKDCPQDVYVYKIYFVNEKGKEFNYSGHISLIR